MYFATAGSSLSPGHISSFNIAQTLVFEMAMRLRRASFWLVVVCSENAHNSCTVWYILMNFGYLYIYTMSRQWLSGAYYFLKLITSQQIGT